MHHFQRRFKNHERGRLEAAGRCAAAAVALIGSSVLLGWAASIESIKRVMPGLVAMNPTTAIAFVLAGASLWMIHERHENRWGRRLAQGCALLVLLVGLLKLLAYLGGLDVGMDQWLFRDRLVGPQNSTPNRMAPNTGLNFALIGMALLWLITENPRGRFIARMLALISAMFSVLAVAGYVNGVTSLYGVASFIPMALHTALTFLILSAAIVAVDRIRSGESPNRVTDGMIGKGDAMKTSLERKVTLGFGAALFMLCLIGIISYKSIQQFIANTASDNHTLVVLATIAELSSDTIDVETAARGFVIAGDESYVRQYRAATDGVGTKFRELRELTSDNPRHQERLDRVDPLISRKIGVAQHTMDLRKQSGFEAARRQVQSGEGRNLMDQLRGVLAEMKDEEAGLLKERSAAVRRSATRTITIISLGSALAFMLVAMAGWMIRRDSASRRIAESALQDSEKRYRFLADSMPQIIWTASPDGNLDYYNSRWHDYTGMTFEQSKEWGWKPVFHPDELQGCSERWIQSLQTGKQFDGEYRIRRASDGAYRWHLCRGMAHRDEQGIIIRWVGTCTDIEDQKQAESALREAKERLRMLVEGVRDYVLIMLDPNGLIATWNSGAERIKGYKQEEIIGQHFSRFYTPEDQQQHKPERELKTAIEKGRYEEDGWRVRKDGRLFWANVVISAVRDDKGVLRGFAKVTRDITERKRAEEEIRNLNDALRQHAAIVDAANKELEAFSYSVSHDLRAPLRSIDGFSQALMEDFADKLGEDGRDSLQRVRAATQRMGQLIDDMLNLSRVTRSEIRQETLDLSAMARAVILELQKAEPQRTVELTVADGMITRGDARLLRVVLDNLIGNAWKFTGRQERARIEFGISKEGAFYIRDNGAGFDMAYAQKLFGAFQRLHAMNEFAGTGVGLATVQRIIHRHGGRVWVDAAVGKGATFYFTLAAEEANLHRAA